MPIAQRLHVEYLDFPDQCKRGQQTPGEQRTSANSAFPVACFIPVLLSSV